MRWLVLSMLLVPAAVALAAEEKGGAPPDDPMAGWVPRKVTREAADRKEIAALFKAMDDAGKKGDIEAAAALVDFPVLMVTDDKKGQASGEAWSREQWIEVMTPFYKKPMGDMKLSHKPTIFLVTDSLASVDDVVTMTMGKKTITSRNSSLVVRKEGKWLLKAAMEGGWGDMMGPTSQASPAPETAGGATK